MGPRSFLFFPPPSLSGCLFGGIYRDTRGAALSQADRINHFPASPMVSVTLVVSGDLRLLDAPFPGTPEPYESLPSLPRIFVFGPTDHPISSWAPGPVLALTLGIYYDAWLQIGGNPDCINAPDSIVSALEHFAAQEDPDAGWNALCTAFGPVWTSQRPHGWNGIQGVADWARTVTTRAALSGSGRSLRSFERRLKRASGQTQRALTFYSSIEKLHKLSRQSAGTPLADVAIDAGYSDQSHMGRAVRRATGFSPALLNRAIETEEPFWCYRLLGQRF